MGNRRIIPINMKKILLLSLLLLAEIGYSQRQVPRGGDAGQTLEVGSDGYSLEWGTPFSGWSLTGNDTIDSTANFIGTLDDNPFIIRTNDTEKIRVMSGGNIGIGTPSPTNDLSFGNSKDRTIWVESTDSLTNGRGLSIMAGSTSEGGSAGDFIALGQTSRSWIGMAAAPNGNVYACVSGGDIYMQTGGAGDFIALGQTSRSWHGMAAAPNGDVYACVFGGDIYMQTGGAGDFIALGQTSRNWTGMAAAPNGDVYACVVFGDIYMQTGGAGDFIALGQTSRDWFGMAAAPNGNVYACVSGGDIYMQTGGAGDFIALGQTSRNWIGMAAAPNGDVYAPIIAGDIYMQTGGAGDFIALGQTSRNWRGMAAAPNGDVYAPVVAGDIYIQEAFNKSGGNLTLSAGRSNGAGESNIYFQTSPPSTAGDTSLNALYTQMTIVGSGNVGIGTTSPTEKLEVVGGVKSDSIIIGDTKMLESSITADSFMIVSSKSYLSETPPDNDSSNKIATTGYVDRTAQGIYDSLTLTPPYYGDQIDWAGTGNNFITTDVSLQIKTDKTTTNSNIKIDSATINSNITKGVRESYIDHKFDRITIYPDSILAIGGDVFNASTTSGLTGLYYDDNVGAQVFGDQIQFFTNSFNAEMHIVDSDGSIKVRADTVQIDIPSKGDGKVLTSDSDGGASWQDPVLYTPPYYEDSISYSGDATVSADDFTLETDNFTLEAVDDISMYAADTFNIVGDADLYLYGSLGVRINTPIGAMTITSYTNMSLSTSQGDLNLSTGNILNVTADSFLLTNVPTPPLGDSTKKVATTAYVDRATATATYPTSWSLTSTITIGAVTTPPTKATTVENDFVRYRTKEPAIGSNTELIEVDYMYSSSSSAGAAGGSGNYLFELPNGYEFNSTEHPVYTGTTDLSGGSTSIYAIDRGKPQGMIFGDGFYDLVLIVPYDATHFRIISLGGNASDEWVGSGWYPITQNTKVMSFKFTFYKQ